MDLQNNLDSVETIETIDYTPLLKEQIQQQSFTNLALGIIIGLLIVYMFFTFLLRGR